MPQNQPPVPKTKSTWEPNIGFIMLIPTVLPEKTEAGVILPETFVKKSNAGVVCKPEDHMLAGKEVFFPVHAEHQIIDSETDELFYVIDQTQVIMSRVPPPKRERFAVSDRKDGIAPMQERDGAVVGSFTRSS